MINAYVCVCVGGPKSSAVFDDGSCAPFGLLVIIGPGLSVGLPLPPQLTCLKFFFIWEKINPVAQN